MKTQRTRRTPAGKATWGRTETTLGGAKRTGNICKLLYFNLGELQRRQQFIRFKSISQKTFLRIRFSAEQLVRKKSLGSGFQIFKNFPGAVRCGARLALKNAGAVRCGARLDFKNPGAVRCAKKDKNPWCGAHRCPEFK